MASPTSPRIGLVFGAGGIVGAAYHAGASTVLAGFLDAGVPSADR